MKNAEAACLRLRLLPLYLMHILISGVSSAQRPSGICRHAATLAGMLCDRHEVSQVTLLVGRWQVGYFHAAFGLRKSKLRIIGISIHNSSYARNVWYWRTFPLLAREYNPDIVHLSFPAPVLRGRFSCPVVSSIHDLYPYDAPDNFGRRRAIFNRLFLRQCLRESDAVVCSSDFTLDRLRSVVPGSARQRTTRIHQSVTLDPAIRRMPQTLGLEDRPFLLTVAQHRRNKNLTLLIAAFVEWRRRAERNKRACLVIVGSNGPETHHLTSMVRQHCLQGAVLFKSALPDPELCWLYRESMLVIAPSVIEGFGLPVAEALRCCSRVLCSNIPAFREVGGSHCDYFNLNEEQPALALASAIDQSLSRPPIKHDDHRFAPTHIASQYVALYSKLAPRQAPALSVESTSYDEYAG